MLRIKSEVNLEELEKYGFSKKSNGQYVIRDFLICRNGTIKVRNGSNLDRNDKLYDLITAGLVEKVDEGG